MAIRTALYDLSHNPEVYEPAEDSFLLVDALELELHTIRRLNPARILEVGSGSGVVIGSLAAALGNTCLYFTTDINPHACTATSKTASLNKIEFLDSLNTSLFDGFRKNMFDVIIFNPPYVLTEDDEVDGFGINRAWAGGLSGRNVTDVFLSQLPDNLNENGVCYMVALKENNLEEIERIIKGAGLEMMVVIERKILGEHLYILKFTK